MLFSSVDYAKASFLSEWMFLICEFKIQHTYVTNQPEWTGTKRSWGFVASLVFFPFFSPLLQIVAIEYYFFLIKEGKTILKNLFTYTKKFKLKNWKLSKEWSLLCKMQRNVSMSLSGSVLLTPESFHFPMFFYFLICPAKDEMKNLFPLFLLVPL